MSNLELRRGSVNYWRGREDRLSNTLKVLGIDYDFAEFDSLPLWAREESLHIGRALKNLLLEVHG